MGLMDKVKGLLGQHPDKADAGIERAGDMVDDRTQGRYTDKVDKGQDAARDAMGKTSDDDPGGMTR